MTKGVKASICSLAGALWIGSHSVGAADLRQITVVELFQSQGCSSCPPANANLNAIADRPDILALSFAVTYWDRLGWKDSFAHPAFTARQWQYARASGRTHVSTPQMIVNGRGVLIGHRKEEVSAFIGRFGRRPFTGPAIALSGGRVTIAAARAARPADVWLVRYDPRTHHVPIRAGENGGRTLPHKNIVREIYLLGRWSGKPTAFAVKPPSGPYRSAVLVQDGPGGAILSARRI